MSGVEDSKFLLSKIVSSRSVVVLRFVEFNFVVSRAVGIRVEVPGIRIELSGTGVEVNWNLMSRGEESSLLSKIMLSRLLVMGDMGCVKQQKVNGVVVSVSGLGESEIRMC